MQDFTMHPMGVGALIDRTFRIYRQHFVAILFFSLLIDGTADLLISLIQLGPSALSSTSALGALLSGNGSMFLDRFLESGTYQSTGLLSSVLAFLLQLAQFVFIQPLVTGGITVIILAASTGRQDDRKVYLAETTEKYGQLVVLSLAIGLVSVAFIIPMIILVSISIFAFPLIFLFAIVIICAIIFLSLLSAMAYPVAIHENRFGFQWVGRTFHIIKARFWKCIGVSILIYLIISFVSFALGLFISLMPPLLYTVLTVALNAVLAPLSAISITLLYMDIRMSTEGYDLELRAKSMQPDESDRFGGPYER